MVAFARTGKQINILKNFYFKVTFFNGVKQFSCIEVVTDKAASISHCDVSEEESDVEPTGAVGSDIYSCHSEVIFTVLVVKKKVMA